MGKTLHFEGAGWGGCERSKETVGNCRIRTAFHVKNGKAVYLELICGNKLGDEYEGHIDFCYYITGNSDDCNINRLPCERKQRIRYTYDGILNFVNSLGADFEAINVLPECGGYYVHGEKHNTYNYGDEYVVNEEALARMAAVDVYFKNLEVKENGRSNFSLWMDRANNSLLHLLRHFNNYNKHWLIDVSADNWLETMKEAELGRYGC